MGFIDFATSAAKAKAPERYLALRKTSGLSPTDEAGLLPDENSWLGHY